MKNPENEIAEALKRAGGRPFYDRIIAQETVTSTNDLLKELAKAGETGTVAAVAEQQTRGRGRNGRKWETPKGESLALSILLHPSIPDGKISAVTLIMGISAAEAVRNLTGIDVMIKWPNDLVFKGKKLSGTLTEMVPPGVSEGVPYGRSVVIGIGFNVNNLDFPEEIRDVAISFRMITGKTYGISDTAKEVLARFAINYREFESKGFGAFADRYNGWLAGRGQKVVIEGVRNFAAAAECGNAAGKSFEAVLLRADDDGGLLVRRNDGTVGKVLSGEVSVHGIYRA